MKATLPIRGLDAWGSGDYGASRGGKKTHHGIDYAGYPGSVIFPFVGGEVTKIGYPYAYDLSYRYVQITDTEGYKWRYFYLQPLVEKGEIVTEATPIGEIQNLMKRYENIMSHCHIEIKRDGKYIDPRTLI